VYAGVAAPFNFNGLVRHYFMRRGANVVDVQVNLAAKSDRDRQSHDIAVAVRPTVDSIARIYGASAKVAEIPPGPPVLSTLVAEVYAGDDNERLQAANEVKKVFESTPGVVDVDWTVEAPQERKAFRVDRVLAARAGASVEQIGQTLYLALSGAPAGYAPDADAKEATAIVPRLATGDRSSVEALLSIPVATMTGPQPLARFVRVEDGVRESARMRRNLRPVIYVTGDVAGTIESPVYAILEMNRKLDEISVNGAKIARYNAVQPEQLDQLAMKWDGEWQVTIEVFRDLGLAFAAVLILIYVLGRLVPVLQDAPGDHGADPIDADRHPSRARHHRGVLHGHVNDRHDRAGRHHRPQLDPAGGLHPAGRRAGTDVARRGHRSRHGALPADRADRSGRRDWRTGDGARSDFPGPRRRADVRRGRGHDAHHGCCAAPLLGDAASRPANYRDP
jgi:hypothetical protein